MTLEEFYKHIKGERHHFSWIDRATGYKLTITRQPGLFLCGYVTIPNSHVNHVDIPNLDVHGGVTYSSKTHPNEVSNPDEYTIGFDCAQYLDLTLYILKIATDKSVYRNWEYVKHEVESLALQIKKQNNA